MYNNIVNLGFIPLCRKPSNEGTQTRLNLNQAYYDEDKPEISDFEYDMMKISQYMVTIGFTTSL